MTAQAPAEALVRRLREGGRTIAVAESLTGGAVLDALIAVPGASAAVRGGVVAYAADVKQRVLGVPAELLARHGTVHPDVAREMASRVRVLMSADLGLATTGVAGPDPVDGHQPGEAYVAVVGPGGERLVSLLGCTGSDRATIRSRTTDLALATALRQAGDLLG
ncbi:CinA family protein [Isoptericola sp. b441]|uniref:CinA family protein n=1 Tax=Actinotalea lenta TaxID=3064654 RepID=A0ABT9DE87_9CELL|nr:MULTISPECIES: CinA family protein [unclassified Isoptericola]MDO8107382.1 CinA family protein [Isoptericola sp. b441]MDO8120955.1 CinA family protein [Isoptericola sp. b490]